MITKILKKFITSNIKEQIRNFKILAVDYGQYKTIKLWKCIDKHGNEIPWYTYPAIEFLNTFNFQEKIVFEFGSGNSSVYWAKRAKKVISVEHDLEWFNKIKNSSLSNQSIIYKQDNEEYENSILEFNAKFDVIIIDGIRRFQCAKAIENSVNKESEEGFMIILDNSDWYHKTAKYIREKMDLIQVDFHGFSPINNYTLSTSIFFSRNFRFKPTGERYPFFSFGALKQEGEE